MTASKVTEVAIRLTGCFCSAHMSDTQQVSAVVFFLPYEGSGSRPGFQGYTIPRMWEGRLCGEKALRALQSLDISQGLPKPISHCWHND